MSLKKYLADKRVIFVTAVLICVVCGGFLLVQDTPLAVVFFVTILYMAGLFFLAGYDYGRKYRFYNYLIETVKQTEEKTYLSELIEEPSFYEGQILYHILKESSKYQNDRIAEGKRELQEYQEYIQLWAHEIKTPVAAAGLVAKNHPGSSVSSIMEEVDKIEHYVEQILYYTKSSHLWEDYQIKPISLKSVAMEAVKKNARFLIARQMTPVFENLDQQILADEKWFSFVIGQVLENAVKYCAKDRPPSLILSAQKVDHEIIFCVEDNGIGIPDKDIKRIFRKGFTGENGRAYKKSTGMGLYLCKTLCEKMEIKVEAHSKCGEGTRILFYIPAAE
ncbi:MAG: sensor histidine kinase [Lachnospiraceae bacterium]|nr:sensor histidine kinase [Lachnospiraceae bacterium]